MNRLPSEGYRSPRVLRKSRLSSGRLVSICFVLGALGVSMAAAQNTAGVPGPNVREGHKAFQYRVTWDPDLEFYAQRLHYEQSLNDRIMLRGIVFSRETASSSQEYEFFQGELFWQLSPEGPRTWSTGLRFDARVRETGSTGLLGMHWLNQWEIADDLSARFVLLNFVQVGGGAQSGVFPQTRLSIQKSFGRIGVGVESFSSYGKWSDLADFDDQSHQLGPFVNVGFGDGWSVFGGMLFGATDSSADTNWRFWLTKRF